MAITISGTTGIDAGSLPVANTGKISAGAGLPAILNTAGVDRVTVDTSGNVGIGVTPSWHGTYKVLESTSWAIGTGMNSTDWARFGVNSFVNLSGIETYKANGYASRYDQSNGGHKFYTAPSGTVGNAITWTNAMTLDAMGTSLVTLNNGTDAIIRLGYKNGVDRNINIRGNTGTNTSLTFTENNVADRYTIGCMSGYGSLYFKTGPSLADGATRMVLDASGNLGIPTGVISSNTTDNFTLNGKLQPHYGFNLSCTSYEPIGISGYYGISFATSGAQQMILDTSGNLLLKSGNGGIGYGTGAGGTVTQLTSKSTTVTLNKPTGTITMNGSALASGAVGYFFVNNTLCTASDLVHITFSGGVSSINNYKVKTYARNGSFDISVTNESAGSLSEAIVLNFVLIKGAQS